MGGYFTVLIITGYRAYVYAYTYIYMYVYKGYIGIRENGNYNLPSLTYFDWVYIGII